MGNKEKILEILTENELSIKDISQRLGINENEVRVYINRLYKEGKVKKIGKKERSTIYKVVNSEINMKNRIIHDKIDKLEKEKKELKEHIKFLMDFFQENKAILQEKASNYMDKFKQIVEVLR